MTSPHTVTEAMDAETLEALRESITKWQRIADTDGVERGECPLCEKFDGPIGCDGCPVKTKTGRNGCMGSPYWNHRDGDIEAARAELDFLKSLLPPGSDEEKSS